ncbi:MAG: hypothetical protein HYV34_04415 [Candidatus Kerfeldbacteria bacterium]|nr:hypothetical protein [Candidatus Kerfeldbacteria bacterium]
MEQLISTMLAEGVPLETILLLLLLPIVATFIAFSRQVIGLRGFGMYTPLIISFAFVETGLRYGLGIFIAVLLTGTLMRFIVRKARLLYFPRIAIVLTIVALVMFLMLLEGAMSSRTGFISVSIFPLLIIIILVENFVAAQIEHGARAAIILSIETLIVATISYYLLTWEELRQFVFQYPWVILATIFINIGLGRWTGLRLAEYLRFREIFRHVDDAREE